MTPTGLPPTPAVTDDALGVVAEVLGLDQCWLWQRAYHFSLGAGHTIAVCPESAGRLRIEACRWTRPAATLWTPADDLSRLAEIVKDLAGELEPEVSRW